MRRFLPLCVICVVAALGACGGDDDDETAAGTTSAVTGAAQLAPGGCESATTDLMTPLGNKLTTTGARLRNGQLVESEETPGVYYVSAELYGSGDGEIGTWVTKSRFGGGAIHSVDEVAKASSDWSDAEARGYSSADPAIEESRVCVARVASGGG